LISSPPSIVHFLMQKVFRAAEREVLKLDLRSIGAFRRTKRRMDLLGSSTRWRLASGPEVKRCQHDHHGRRCHTQREAELRAFRFLLGNLDVGLFVAWI